MAQRIYTPQAHAFFDSLVAFISSVSALGIAFEVQSGTPAKPFGPHETVAISGLPAVAACEFHIYMGPVLVELLANRWPTQVVIDEKPIAQIAPVYNTWLTGLQGVHGSMISNAFVQFFEANRARAESQFGTNTQSWPNVWNFARVVRNAFAHGGAINITNAKSSAVSWRSLSYDATRNGRQLLYNDLTAVEIILLMDDMNALL